MPDQAKTFGVRYCSAAVSCAQEARRFLSGSSRAQLRTAGAAASFQAPVTSLNGFAGIFSFMVYYETSLPKGSFSRL